MTAKRRRLAQRRKAVGLSQEALANRLNIERSTVVRWESGETEPLPWIRPKLARALQLSVDQLAELLAMEPSPNLASVPTTRRGRRYRVRRSSCSRLAMPRQSLRYASCRLQWLTSLGEGRRSRP
jgi:transcriptional regulator with XRE-family HTH domain